MAQNLCLSFFSNNYTVMEPGVKEMPQPEQPIYNTLGYVIHEGKHGVMPQDWDYYLEFLKRYL